MKKVTAYEAEDGTLHRTIDAVARHNLFQQIDDIRTTAINYSREELYEHVTDNIKEIYSAIHAYRENTE